MKIMNDNFKMWVGNNESKWSGLNIHNTTKCHIFVEFHYFHILDIYMKI